MHPYAVTYITPHRAKASPAAVKDFFRTQKITFITTKQE
jgi:hypothetical protein